MECRVCGIGPGDGEILLRQNAEGEDPSWACLIHNAVEQGSAVMETVAVLSLVLSG